MGETLTETLPTDAGDGAAPAAAGARLFLVLECERPLAAPLRIDLAPRERLVVGRGADRVVSRDGLEVIVRLGDPWMSGRHVRVAVRDGGGGWSVEDLGSRNGTSVNGVRRARADLADGDVLEIGRSFWLFRAAAAAPAADELPGVATASSPFADALRRAARVAPTDLPVLILGESGTGKEVVARALHAASRRPGAFVALNCGALPANLVEAELFGHRRGAFTGATEDRAGIVREADCGTLFLDEIGDLAAIVAGRAAPRAARARGDARRRRAAGARRLPGGRGDAQGPREAGRERGVPLRFGGAARWARGADSRRSASGVRTSASSSRRCCAARRSTGKRPRSPLRPEAARALTSYDWPLNVRELERCLAAAVALADGGRIGLEQLSEAVRRDAPRRVVPDAPTEASQAEGADGALRAELERRLGESGGNLSAVARAMGKGRTQIQRWVRRFGLDPGSFRPPEG